MVGSSQNGVPLGPLESKWGSAWSALVKMGVRLVRSSQIRRVRWFRLSQKNCWLYYQPSWIQAPLDLKGTAPFV